jgi:hypothetical protein
MVIRTLVCWLLFTLGILAQSGGTITGTVVNLSGDPVAKAVIQATNAETKPSIRRPLRPRAFIRSRNCRPGPTS